MLEERVIYLINADIDGELGSAERAELASILESSADARALQVELRRLAVLMDGLPDRAPPADLAGRILEQVRLQPEPVRSGSASRPKFSLAGLLASFQPAQAGVAFAAGLLLTMGFYEVSQRDGTPADLSNMVGTMLAKPSDSGGREMDSLSIAQPGLSGTVSLGEIGNYLVMNFDLDSAEETEIVIGLAEAGLGFGGIAHASADGSTEEFYEVSGGTLRVVNQGRQAFSVFLPRVTDPSRVQAARQDGSGRQISIGISTGGAVTYRGVLQG